MNDKVRSIGGAPMPSTSPTEDACKDLEAFIARVRAGEFSIKFGMFIFLDEATHVNTYAVNEADRLQTAGLLALSARLWHCGNT